MHSLSYGIRGSSESCCEHSTVQWMTRWPFLGKGKKKILIPGTKTYKCISLLFLGYIKFIHVKEERYPQTGEKKVSEKKNLKTSVKTLVWTNKGLIFTSKKVKVTRLVLTVSLCGDKRIHHKASSACITIGSWLENGWVQLTMKNELPLCLNKKPLNLISPGQKHNHIPGAMCDSAQKANFNLFCTFEHTQKPIWFSLK